MLFYDFEVFKYDWLVVIRDTVTRSMSWIYNDVPQLQSFVNNHKKTIWVGYNSSHYDQWILSGILDGRNAFDTSQQIIVQKLSGWNMGLRPVILNFDAKTKRDESLKQLEGHMGHNIYECDIPWDIDRPLFGNEVEEVLKYCDNDVLELMNVFMNRKEEFTSKMGLISEFKLPLKWIGKTKVQLSSAILKANKVDRHDTFDLTLPDCIELDQYEWIRQWYMDKLNLAYNNSLDTTVAGIPHSFAWGGLHGAIRNYAADGLFLNMDVASFYPSMMIEYDFMSRNVPNPKKFEEIRDTRIKLKKKRDPRQAVYKIVLNGSYGAMKDQYNQLFDPRQANNVCVTGQLLLLDLIEKVEPYCETIQSNTDGVLVKVVDETAMQVVIDIAKEWEKRTRMELDYDRYVRVIQKDVNNYIIVDAEGKYKSKGAYVKKLSPMDCDLEIVNEALIQYFLHDIKPEATIGSCDVLKKFQTIIRVSAKYDHGQHGVTVLNEKCVRLFASQDWLDPAFYRVKDGKPNKAAGSPEHCRIMNESVIGVEIPKWLDRSYYVAMAWKRIEDFKGSKNGQIKLF